MKPAKVEKSYVPKITGMTQDDMQRLGMRANLKVCVALCGICRQRKGEVC